LGSPGPFQGIVDELGSEAKPIGHDSRDDVAVGEVIA
jgi:hypothetical protein